MKHKLLIVISTVLVFVLTVILSLVWLLKIRYVEVNVVAETNYERDLYNEIVEVLDKEYVGKSYLFVNESDVEKTITANPYVKVKEIKKVFPDRILVSVERRKEQFAISYNGEYYLTDKEYFLLKKTADKGSLSKDVVEIALTDVQIDSKTLVEGKIIGYDNNVLVGSTTDIFSKFDNGFNLVKNIEIIGSRNWIRFYTKTGVCIEFSFSPIGGESVVSKEFAQTIVAKTEEVEAFYNGLNETQKSEGFIIVLTKDSGEITISYDTEKAN